MTAKPLTRDEWLAYCQQLADKYADDYHQTPEQPTAREQGYPSRQVLRAEKRKDNG